MSVAIASAEAGPSSLGYSAQHSLATNNPRRHGKDGSTKDEKKQRRHKHKKRQSTSPSLASEDGDTSAASDGDGASVTSEISQSSARHGTDVEAQRKVTGKAQAAFKYVRPVIDVPLPPALLHDPRRAAEELIDTLLMRYVPQLGGVLLSHSNMTFMRRHANFDADSAFAIVPVAVTCLLWAPEVGMRLQGQLKLSTPSHISLLVHGIFNASITAAHLPSSLEAPQSGSSEVAYDWHEYEALDDAALKTGNAAEGEDWEPMEGMEGAAEAAALSEARDAGDAAGTLLSNAADVVEKSTGYWISRKTGQKLGEDKKNKDGHITFTVVGMTIANHMLSIHGSLLKRPFSVPAPTHVPTLVKTMPIEAAASETARRVRFNEENQTSEFHAYRGEDSSSSDESGDEDNVHSAVKDARRVKPSSSSSSKRSDTSNDAGSSKSGKKRSKQIGPRREGDTTTSGESESESDASSAKSHRHEKKKRKKA